MGIFSRKPRIVDPFNTMGTAGSTPPARPLIRAPYRDSYTPDRVIGAHDLRDHSVEEVARGYGLTLSAAKRFRSRFEDAQTYSGTRRGDQASAECGDILDNPKNRKRW